MNIDMSFNFYNINKNDLKEIATALRDKNKKIVMNTENGDVRIINIGEDIKGLKTLNNSDIIDLFSKTALFAKGSKENSLEFLRKFSQIDPQLSNESSFSKEYHLFNRSVKKRKIENLENENLLTLVDRGQIDNVIRCLEERRDLLVAQDSNQKTLLHMAIETKNLEFISRLILLNAPLNLKDNNGNTALDYLTDLDSTQLLPLLESIAPPKAESFRKLLELSKDLLKPMLQTLKTKAINSYSNLIEEVYHYLAETRYEILINAKRAIPSDLEIVKRANLFIKRAKKNVETKIQQFNLNDVQEDKNSDKYRSWIENRMNLSGTVSRVGAFSTPEEESAQATDNWLKANALVFELAKEKKEITIEVICQIHEILGYNLPNNGGVAGKLRSTDIKCGEKNYIPGSLVEKKMKETVEWLQQTIEACQRGEGDPIECAALAYQRFVSIHPFSDANGRCCRMIMDYTLQLFGYPPAELTTEQVSVAVFAQLPDNDPHNIHPLLAIQFVYEGVQKSLNSLL